jgi:hypothetical protein
MITPQLLPTEPSGADFHALWDIVRQVGIGGSIGAVGAFVIAWGFAELWGKEHGIPDGATYYFVCTVAGAVFGIVVIGPHFELPKPAPTSGPVVVHPGQPSVFHPVRSAPVEAAAHSAHAILNTVSASTASRATVGDLPLYAWARQGSNL